MTKSRKRVAIASMAMVATVAAGSALIVQDPYRLVRAEFLRQRIAAGLSTDTLQVAGHRWVDARRDAASRDAPTIVMVHGYTGSKENWYPMAALLGDRYSLRIPDLPGWGDSQRKPDIDYGFSAQAARVAEYIRAVSPGKPVVLLGHSMGGGIAAVTAARYPELVARVGLFDAAGVRFADNQFGIDVLAGKNPFGVQDEAQLKRYIDTVFHDDAAKPRIPWPASKGLIDKRRADAAFEQQVLSRIGRSEETFLPGNEATRIQQPTLLLWCRQDAVIDSSAMALYAERIPQATSVLLDGCGHMSMMEQAGNAAAAVIHLIEKGQPR